jgi:hypothetical protein
MSNEKGEIPEKYPDLTGSGWSKREEREEEGHWGGGRRRLEGKVEGIVPPKQAGIEGDLCGLRRIFSSFLCLAERLSAAAASKLPDRQEGSVQPAHRRGTLVAG